jgi:hypothetical protein
MSGHNGFIAIGNNNPPINPIIANNVGGVQPPANPNPPPVAPGGSEPLQVAPEQGRARELAKQLDVLLLRAGQASTKGIDAEAVKTQVRGFGLGKRELKAVNALIDNAAKTMNALDKFSGRDLAMATSRDIDGHHQWDLTNPAGKAIQAALDAQAALSEKMFSLIQSGKLTREAKAICETTAMTCDRRACELETLVMQFAEAVAKVRHNDPNTLDPEVRARLDTKVFSLMGEKAASMHGHAEALEHMRAQLAPLAKRLDDFSANPDKSIASPAFAAMRQEFTEAKTALATLTRDGYKAGEGRVHPDSAFLDAAKEILAQVEQRMTSARQRLAQAALDSYMDSIFAPPPSLSLLAPKFRPLLKILYPQAARLVMAKDAVHTAARTYAKDPSAENLAALKSAIADYNQDPTPVGAKNIGENLATAALGFLQTDDAVLAATIEKKKAKLPAADRAAVTPELVAEFKAALTQYTKGEAPTNAFAAFYKPGSFYRTQLAHFEDMRKTVERMGDEDFLSSKTFLSAFDGEVAPSTLVEARVHGMKDDDVDPATDPSNVDKARPLGHGAVNTVIAVTFKNGEVRVFKPEAAGRAGLENAPYVFEGYTRNQQLAQLNMATQKTADVLGLGDVMAKTSVGKHDGQYGIFMAKAPGTDLPEFANNNKLAKGSLNANGVQMLSAEEHAKVQGKLMRKCNRLDWFDAITGQGDRHNGNVYVDVRRNGEVDVTGIDNDTCYPAHRIGLDKYVVSGKHLGRFNALVDDVASLYEDTEEDPKGRLLSDPGVIKNDDGTYTLDASKFKSPELNYCLMYTFGIYSNHVPNYIDKDLYDHLQALKAGPQRDAYLADLKTRLSPGAFDAAVKRLDDAIARADALQAQKRVYTEDDWNDRDKQKAVYNDPGEKPPVLDPQYRKVLRTVPKSYQKIQVGIGQMTQGNYRRNGFYFSAKIGWFN